MKVYLNLTKKKKIIKENFYVQTRPILYYSKYFEKEQRQTCVEIYSRLNVSSREFTSDYKDFYIISPQQIFK